MGNVWRPPLEVPDLRRVPIIGLDIETKDERLAAELGPGWPIRAGHICGVSIAWRDGSGVLQTRYFPIRHPDTQCFEPERIYQWLRDHIAAGCRFATQNGLYDWGWFRSAAGIPMPEGHQLEEIGALATLVDEDRLSYKLDDLCRWRGIPGKDETLLIEGLKALGLVSKRTRKINPKPYLHAMPARFVGPYAERDAGGTLELFESLDPVLDQEGTRNAYRMECALLPMVQEMEARGIRVDSDTAERNRDLFYAKRDALLAELSEKLEVRVGVEDVDPSNKAWLTATFDRLGIEYPLTDLGNPSFRGGNRGWMVKHSHPVPNLIAKINRYHHAGHLFLQNHILDHIVGGRIHASFHPHRSEGSGDSDRYGAKSFRFAVSEPPLQQMPKRDQEITPLIRNCFLPEKGQVWAALDASQQEFRLVVHYAMMRKLTGAAKAADEYINNPAADIHAYTGDTTGLGRDSGKTFNFAKIYSAGVAALAEQLGKSKTETQELLKQYDAKMPFIVQLSNLCRDLVDRDGFIEIYGKGRRHFNRWAPSDRDTKWTKGAGPCERDEALERQRDPNHPWHRLALARVKTYTALNALIQGSAAIHTKRWMVDVWRSGYRGTMLQMHDCLDCSVSSKEEAEAIALLGEDAVRLTVPMLIDRNYGLSWGDANHTWEELKGLPAVEPPAIAGIARWKAAGVKPDPTLEPDLSGRPRQAPQQNGSAPIPAPAAPPKPKPTEDATASTVERAAGFSDADIFEMAPAQAHAALEGIAPAPSAPPASATVVTPPTATHTNGSSGPQLTNGGLVPPWEDDEANVQTQAPAASVAPPTAAAKPVPAPTPSPSIVPPADLVVPPQPPQGGSRAGTHGHSTKHAGEPYDDTHLLKHYTLKKAYSYALGDGTELYQNVRYELKPGIAPAKKRREKEFLTRRKVGGLWAFGAGDRRVPYNWPAIMKAGPGAEVFVCEGEANADGLIERGLLATTALSHDWAPECVAALTGMHAYILEDFDSRGEWYAARAQEKLEKVAASTRVIGYGHLWSKLPEAARATPPTLSEDIQDWLEARGGDVGALKDICREIPIKGSELEAWDAGEMLCGSQEMPREWLIWGQFCRGFLSGLVAPGETGKTTLRITQAVELATGKELLGSKLFGRRKVLIVCFEDDEMELRRRIRAACIHHHIDPGELKGWLFCRTLNSGPKLAELDGSGRKRMTGRLDGMLRRAIEQLGCDLVILDPFIKIHSLNENDNPDMDFVCSALVRIAQDCNIAVDCPAHTHKGAITGGDADARRGASAQRDAGRLDYTLTVMSQDDAEGFGIAEEERKAYVRLDKAKANIVRAMKAYWFRLENVNLGNGNETYVGGDDVQAIEPWTPPETFADVDAATTNAILDDIARGTQDGRRYSNHGNVKDRQAWQVVQIHCPTKQKTQCREMIKQWLQSKLLFVDEYDDPVESKSQKGLFVNDSKRPT
jgi:DNA polymerase I-like protein with 3'-5' exonuclease and polymerase domains